MLKPSYQVWFDKANDNLKWANDNLKDGNFPLVCYLSQQAVELALKGYLYSRNEIPPRTHQLIRLSEVCRSVGLDLESFLPLLAKLSEYYFGSRYPDEFNEELESRGVAEEAIEMAEKILGFVKEKLQ